MRELLQVHDSLELGHDAALAQGADIAKLREGTELTLKLLGDVMAKFGVERSEPRGQPFNPEFHQAMSVQPRDDLAPNTVVAVMQKGYTPQRPAGAPGPGHGVPRRLEPTDRRAAGGRRDRAHGLNGYGFPPNSWVNSAPPRHRHPPEMRIRRITHGKDHRYRPRHHQLLRGRHGGRQRQGHRERRG